MVSMMVDNILVERILADIENNISELQRSQDITWDVYTSDIRSRRFVERTLHVLIEGVIDIAQHIVSDEKLREPISYRDTFVVLSENGILARESLLKYEKMAAFRNLIVHYYERVDDEVVFGIFQKNLLDFQLFSEEIKNFLKSKRP